MRLCSSLALCLAAAAPLLVAEPPAQAGPGVPAAPGIPAAPAVAPCADGPRFPLITRIEGGPDTYRAGGGPVAWSVKLTNTTDRSCGDVHPVVVLVDERRELRPDQTRLEFDDADRRAHPVHFETTDEDELVGAFDDGFPGFTVGPKKTVSVTVRLAFAADAVPNDVTVKAAVVQRRGNKGEWVGRSNDYAFRVEEGPDSDTDPDSDSGVAPRSSAAATAAPSRAASAAPSPDASGPVVAPPPGRSSTPAASASASGAVPPSGRPSGTQPPSLSPTSSPTPSSSAGSADRGRRLPLADELAATGLTGARGILALAAVLLVTGGALLVARRRR
ncbi:hypothetical protein AB0465_09120 [Streptomyces griseoviridis]|uniref:hypothetical protein n=1 Tax=Streptomyces griseoviridis TaxID=45398 RepID=UPI00344E19E8